MAKFTRKQYIVDKGVFQTRFLLPFVVSWFVAVSINVWLFNLLVKREINNIIWHAHITVDTTDQIIGRAFGLTIAVTFVLILVLLNLSCFLVKKKSNGVVLRMVKDLRAVAGGNFSRRIWLRKKDSFRDVAARLNDYLDDKAARYARLKKSARRISDDLHKVQIAAAKG
ncbi:MAG: hypothetical protein GXP59_02595, partial [Deltaproteobacteria bacterium]|nr:hypothetical protein [Deltaproteobacteria bacterium]